MKNRINKYYGIEHINVTEAFLSLIDSIVHDGCIITGKNGVTQELNSISFTANNPLDRVFIIPGRKNNIFATIAESLWVLAGRNDIEFIKRYLPRAIKYSDNGTTWRAGYGPRIRNWHGNVDQVCKIYRQLKNEIISRRAVISIFDPESDFQESKDIPCNNLLLFLCRNDALDVTVVLRSSDLF